MLSLFSARIFVFSLTECFGGRRDFLGIGSSQGLALLALFYFFMLFGIGGVGAGGIVFYSSLNR